LGTFLEFVKGKKEKDKAHLWFTIFLKNWMDIFFNENQIEDHSTFSIFEEVKRKGMTSNLALQVPLCICLCVYFDFK